MQGLDDIPSFGSIKPSDISKGNQRRQAHLGFDFSHWGSLEPQKIDLSN